MSWRDIREMALADSWEGERGTDLDAADRSGKAWCPRQLKVTFAGCYERYVEANARNRRADPCHDCVIGAGRRLAFGTGHEPTEESVASIVEMARRDTSRRKKGGDE